MRVPFARLWRFPSGSRGHASTRWYLHCRYCWNLSRPDHLLSAVRPNVYRDRWTTASTASRTPTLRRRPSRRPAPAPGTCRPGYRQAGSARGPSGGRSVRRDAGRRRLAHRSRSRPHRAARRHASTGPRVRRARRRSCRPRRRGAAAPRRFAQCPAEAPPEDRHRSRPQLSDEDLAARGAPLLRERRALGLVEGNLEHSEPEQRALEAHGRERDADLLEQLFLRHRGHILGGSAHHDLGQHRRRGLADRAATPLEADALDHIVRPESHRDGHLVAAERILALRDGIVRLEQAVIPRRLVVVEDDLAIELLELAHPRLFLTLWRPSTRRSISSGTEYR